MNRYDKALERLVTCAKGDHRFKEDDAKLLREALEVFTYTCGQCGQRLMDDNRRGRSSKRIYKALDSDGNVVFSGTHGEVQKRLGINVPLEPYMKSGSKVKGIWRITYEEKGS